MDVSATLGKNHSTKLVFTYLSILDPFFIVPCRINISNVFIHLFSPTALFLVSQYTDKEQQECCLDGMKGTTLSYTCKRLGEYIGDGSACAEAFVKCCEIMETLQAENKADNLQLARSKQWGWDGGKTRRRVSYIRSHGC